MYNNNFTAYSDDNFSMTYNHTLKTKGFIILRLSVRLEASH